MSAAASNWPPGQQVLPQRYVDEGKRVRCAFAVAEVAHDQGPAKVTTTEIVKRAGISRNTFYDIFESIEEALRFAWQRSGSWLSQPVVEAVEGKGPWTERAVAAIDALLATVAERPRVAELYLVHAPCLVGAEAGLQSALIEPLSAVLTEGAQEHRLHPDLAEGLPELVASGIVSVIAMRLRRGEANTLPDLRDELVTLALTSTGVGADPDGRLRVVGGGA